MDHHFARSAEYETATFSGAKYAVNTKRRTKPAMQCLCYSFDIYEKSVYACSQYFEIVIMIVLSEGGDNNRIKPLYIFLRGFYQLFLFEIDRFFFVKLH